MSESPAKARQPWWHPCTTLTRGHHSPEHAVGAAKHTQNHTRWKTPKSAPGRGRGRPWEVFSLEYWGSWTAAAAPTLCTTILSRAVQSSCLT